jgi:hypothetical protein
VSPRHGRSTSTRASKIAHIHTQRRYTENLHLSQRQHMIKTTRTLQVVQSSDSAPPNICINQRQQPQHQQPQPYNSPSNRSPNTPSPCPTHSEPWPNDIPLEFRRNNASAPAVSTTSHRGFDVHDPNYLVVHRTVNEKREARNALRTQSPIVIGQRCNKRRTENPPTDQSGSRRKDSGRRRE